MKNYFFFFLFTLTE